MLLVNKDMNMFMSKTIFIENVGFVDLQSKSTLQLLV